LQGSRRGLVVVVLPTRSMPQWLGPMLAALLTLTCCRHPAACARPLRESSSLSAPPTMRRSKSPSGSTRQSWRAAVDRRRQRGPPGSLRRRSFAWGLRSSTRRRRSISEVDCLTHFTGNRVLGTEPASLGLILGVISASIVSGIVIVRVHASFLHSCLPHELWNAYARMETHHGCGDPVLTLSATHHAACDIPEQCPGACPQKSSDAKDR
jgi:hypothetical protein